MLPEVLETAAQEAAAHAMMALAPWTDQCMPARLSRAPMVVLQPVRRHRNQRKVLGHGSRRTASGRDCARYTRRTDDLLTLGGFRTAGLPEGHPDGPRPGPRNPLRPTPEGVAGLPRGAPWRRPRSSPGRDTDQRSQSPRGTVRQSRSRSRGPRRPQPLDAWPTQSPGARPHGLPAGRTPTGRDRCLGWRHFRSPPSS